MYCLAARGAPRSAGDGGRSGWNGPELWIRRTKTWLRSRACLEKPKPLLRQSMPDILQAFNWLYRGVIREEAEEVIKRSGV